ncbi:unnamed protein product [Caenorhabditis auriculariae]|uniref:Uncharacterized protein n=1 Tax=Caenorhabditis auriculariae TaxID=2777116 RepID=A0A8S1HIV1_9PELO|nr:unnamed protein product [Caenorhabditis auriculariae]
MREKRLISHDCCKSRINEKSSATAAERCGTEPSRAPSAPPTFLAAVASAVTHTQAECHCEVRLQDMAVSMESFDLKLSLLALKR